MRALVPSEPNRICQYFVGMENGLVDLSTLLSDTRIIGSEPIWMDMCVVVVSRSDLFPQYEISLGTSVRVPILRIPFALPSSDPAENCAHAAYMANEAEYSKFIAPFCQHDGSDLVKEISSSMVGRTQCLELACASALGTLEFMGGESNK